MTLDAKPNNAPARRPTIKDVATRAGVALGTVSRILNGNSTVAPALRDHVRAVIAEIGYQPDLVARSMRAQKTHVLGCIVTDISQPVAAAMIAGAAEVAGAAGYALFVSEFRNDRPTEERIFQVMKDRRIDGLLATVGSDEDIAQRDILLSLPFPVVLWERDFEGGLLDSVLTDHRFGVRLATEHLIAQGYGALALVSGHAGTWTGREQAAGFRAACEAHFGQTGAAIESRIMTTDAFAQGSPVLEAARRKPLGVVANIHDIPRLLKQARSLGLEAPRDIGLISIGDAEFLEVLDPAVTAIRGDPQRLGTMAAQRLLKRIDTMPDDAPMRQLERPQLIVRASSARR